jgi:hypothetical protein
MPLTSTVLDSFRRRYKVTLDEVSSNPNDPLRHHDDLSRESNARRPVQQEEYGRGYVSFGKSASAREADRSTLQMMSEW